jgi:predicted permease
MAFAIAVGAVTFELVTMIMRPDMPLPGGDRIVQVRLWDAERSEWERRSLHDFNTWRQALRSVTELGAYQDVVRNVIADDGEARPTPLAEISASAFRVASGTPLLGRTLLESDERPGAPPVVVLGYDLWRTRFGSRASVVGQTVQVGDGLATVVGVMREGFAFPISHELWMPFRPDAASPAPREGPGITVFGRLAPRVSWDAAQAELAALGRRAATELPATHAHLQPHVAPFTTVFLEMSPRDFPMFLAIPVFAVMLLVLVCGNVALLLFARAATRETELVVRSALGASRGRIVAQLFAEALVLGALAAVMGLGAAAFGLEAWGRKYLEVNQGQLPFWYDPHLSLATVLYAIALTVLGAAIAGVLPGLKVTHGLGARLKQGTAGSGLRFGGVWTAVIVAQVAVTAAFPAVVLVEQREMLRMQRYDVGFRSQEFLGVRMELEAATSPGASAAQAGAARRARYGAALEEVRRRLAGEPGVEGVTFVDRLPRMGHPERLAEVEGAPSVPRDSLPEASVAVIDPAYFEVLQAPMLAGRAFNSGDIGSDAPVAIVDRSFVELVLKGRSAVGQRVRLVQRSSAKEGDTEAEPWFEIVGVAKDLGMTHPGSHTRPSGIYVPTPLASNNPLYMVVHAKGDPMSLVPRVRAIATSVDPALRLSELERVDRLVDGMIWFISLWLRMTVVLTAIALLLSLAGIYAVMSFTVSRRTREIGIRIALGASARRMVASIFRRPLTQVGVGVMIGSAIAGVLLTKAAGVDVSPTGVGLLVLYAAVILGVCLLACVVPTRRALGVEPMEALRAD